MRIISHVCGLLPSLCVVFFFGSLGAQADPRYQAPENSSKRSLVVISDLHMGLGKVNGEWHPYEDFRWPKALKGFLDEVSRQFNNNVDLVIAGDFLELWQIPDDIPCKGDGPGLGCSVKEMSRITQRVIIAHSGKEGDTPRAFDALKEFSQRGDNRLHLLPGNHDAALLVPEIWQLVADALEAQKGRVRLVGKEEKGTWTSTDGRVVIEHGQQMGADLNKFKQWPQVREANSGLMIRSEGELNVQKLFNDVERSYPIIDNLSPEVRGAWYRAQDQGVWGSIGDVAKLVAFLLFETSIEHKAAVWGGPSIDDRGNVAWDLDYARDTLGYKLFAYGLPKDDAVRKALLIDAPSEEIKKVRKNLKLLAKALDDADLAHMCDQLALQGEARCWNPTAGALSEALLSSRTRVKRNHLKTRKQLYPNMDVFIYGHTHHLEKGHGVELDDITIVTVFNSGAFQRVMDDENYRRRLEQAHKGVSAAEGLSKLKLKKDFKPCYTAVLGKLEDGKYKLETKRWYMPENGAGKLIDVGDKCCRW